MKLIVVRKLPSYIPASQFAQALLDLVTRGPVPPVADPDAAASVISIDSLRASAGVVQNPKVQRAVLSAIDLAQGDLDKAKANIENWYNGTMDRMSGWYKRRTQTILFFIGLGVAIVMNVDAILVAERLNTDKQGAPTSSRCAGVDDRWSKSERTSGPAEACRSIEENPSTTDGRT